MRELWRDFSSWHSKDRDVRRPAYAAVRRFAATAAEQLDDVTLSVVGFTLDDDEIAQCRSFADEIGAQFRVR